MSADFADEFTADELADEIIDAETEDYPEDAPGSTEGIDTSFFDSPNFADFVKRTKTAVARDYEKRVASLVKTIAFGRMQSPGGLPDAAALIYNGANFSAASGMLAAEDKYAAKMIDIITSPENPYVVFAIAAIPMVAQLMRNHEADLQGATAKVKMTRAQRKAHAAAHPKPVAELTIPILKKKIRVKVPFRIKLTMLRSQSVDPGTLVNVVFSDVKVRRELRKQGVKFGE